MASRSPARMIGTVTRTDLRRGATMNTTTTTTVDQYDHVAAAEYLMKHAGTTALAVLDGQHSDRAIGCITETDIAEATASGQDPNQTRVRNLIVPRRGRSASMSAH
jgi:CBS domain-containing protein